MGKYRVTRHHVFDRWVFVEGDVIDFDEKDLIYVNRNVPGLLVPADDPIAPEPADRMVKKPARRRKAAAP